MIRTLALGLALAGAVHAQAPWERVAPIDLEAGAAFGRTLALDGSRLAVGAPFNDGPLANANAALAGRVYVYRETAQGWLEEALLAAHDGQPGDTFGFALELGDQRLLVGAPGHGALRARSGKVYCFERAGKSWHLVQELVGSDTESGDHFGTALALDGERLLVGAPLEGFGHAEDWGKVYVFERHGGAWVEVEAFTTPDVERGDWVGYSVDLQGDRALIGSYTDDAGALDGGSAWIFERGALGWEPRQKLLPSQPGAFEHFSVSVQLDGDLAYVGAHRAGNGAGTGLGRGAVTLYKRGTSGFWVELARLSPDWLPPGSVFGLDLALSSNGALWTGAPGAYGGCALRWLLPEQWTGYAPAALSGSWPGFGAALAVRAETIASGAPYESGTGAVFVFDAAGAGARRTTCAGTGGLWTSGSLDLTRGDLALEVTGRTPAAYAVAILGTPLGVPPAAYDGLCVGGPPHALAQGVTDAGGSLSLPLGMSTDLAGVTAGSTWAVQVWTHDGAFGPGLELRFEPQ